MAPDPSAALGAVSNTAVWQAGRFRVNLDRPLVMAIINLTPDSFSDGGRHGSVQSAVDHARHCLEQGADLLDLGAESTRPGANPIDEEQEWSRLAPVLNEAVRWDVPISVDTRRMTVMRRALDAGADIINDVQALQSPGAVELLADRRQAGVCLMHMRGEPGTMQEQAVYADVVSEVGQWLHSRALAVQSAGISADRILLDPGIGFAKTPEQNLRLLEGQAALAAGLSRPLLIGWSRKSTLGVITGRSQPTDRLASSVAAALLAAQAGAAVLRVHDVAATVDALKVWASVGCPRTQSQSQV